MNPEMVSTTPFTLSKSASVHQKQPLPNVATSSFRSPAEGRSVWAAAAPARRTSALRAPTNLRSIKGSLELAFGLSARAVRRLWHELQRHAVYAVAQTRGRRSVLKY